MADLFDRTTHIDVDDAGAFADIENSGLRHHLRIRSGDLHGNWIDFALMIQTSGRFHTIPKLRVACSHLRHGITGP